MTADLIKLLRERLSRTDLYDIANEFGERAGLGRNLSDRLAEGGLDDRISALVARVEEVTKLDVLVDVIGSWRADLAQPAQAATTGQNTASTTGRADMSEPKEEKQNASGTHNYYGTVFQGGNPTISGIGQVFGGTDVTVTNTGNRMIVGGIEKAESVFC